MGVRRMILVCCIALAGLAGTATTVSAGVAVRSTSAPAGYHRVKVKAAGVSLLLPNKWKVLKDFAKSAGAAFAAGDSTFTNAIGIGVVKKVTTLPTDPGLEDTKVAGKPAKVKVVDDKSGSVATTFYVLAKKNGVTILCESPTDARQDPTFQVIIKSVKLL